MTTPDSSFPPVTGRESAVTPLTAPLTIDVQLQLINLVHRPFSSLQFPGVCRARVPDLRTRLPTAAALR